MSEQTQPFPVKDLANALATALHSHNRPNGHAPVVRVKDPKRKLGDGLSGSVDIEITYDGSSYELKVTVPDGTTTHSYDFALTYTSGGGQPIQLAEIKYQDGGNWFVHVEPPPFSLGPITFSKIAVELNEGAPT